MSTVSEVVMVALLAVGAVILSLGLVSLALRAVVRVKQRGASR